MQSADITGALSIGAPAYAVFNKLLKPFDLQATAATISGLLTVPDYHVGTVRLELLLHLACLHCRGKRRPKPRDLTKWVDDVLGSMPARRLEDPVEDVFVSNVIGPGGNYRIFEGTWEASDHYLQHFLDCITRTRWSVPHRVLRQSALALLTLSDAAAGRAGLERWTRASHTTPRNQILGGSPDIGSLSSRITFTYADCEALGVSPDALAPFVYPLAHRKHLAQEFLGNSSLERRPVFHFPGAVVLACPAAVSPAIRHFVLHWCQWAGELPAFARLLREGQRQRVFGSLLRHIAAPTDMFAAGFPTQPPRVPAGTPADSVVCAIDTDKAAHVILLHDDVGAVAETGIIGSARFDGSVGYGLDRHILDVADYLRSNGARAGLTLLVFGGVGRGCSISLPRLPKGWHVAHMHVADLETFAWSPDASLLRLWKLYEQLAEAAAHGIVVSDTNGTLNLYAYWAHHGFRLLPKEMPYPAPQIQLRIGSNFVFELRADERMKHDRHAAALDERRFVSVTRLRRGSFFQSLEMHPVYGAEELAHTGVLAGVVEGSSLTVWVYGPECSTAVRRFGYDLWEAALGWIQRALPILEGRGFQDAIPPLALRLSLGEPERWASYRDQFGEAGVEYPAFTRDLQPFTARVEVPFGFLTLLRRPSNDAERALANTTFLSIQDLLSSAGIEFDASARSLVDAALPTAEVRALHVLEAGGAADRIALERRADPRVVQPEDEVRWQWGLAWDVLEQRRDPVEASGIEDCVAFLDTVVEKLWQRIRGELQEIDAASLVRIALSNVEEISRDRSRWRRTARAVLASFGADPMGVAGRHEADLALTNLVVRIVVEMAVPTCPAAGGRSASLEDLDRLTGGVAVLIQYAADRAAIDGGVSEPRLTIYPDGSIEAQREFIDSVASPYVLESFGVGFRAAANSYEFALKPRDTEAIEQEEKRLSDPAFVHAFVSEYGLGPSRLVDAVAEILDMAIEGQTLVLESTRAPVAVRLRERRGYSDEETESFFRMFALVPRERWDAAPPGFAERDWKPWRFRRRLSVVSRPMIALGTKADSPIFVGVDQIGASLSYLLDSIRLGWFPVEYFRCREMRAYLGSVTDALGHAFTAEVAADLGVLGWNTRAEVQMRTLGATKELGDLDIVAWDERDGRLLLVECKRLQPARTMGEIVERLNEFRGDASDRLGKHLRRIEWVRQNLPAVRKRLGLPGTALELTPLLITNSEVPMRFAHGLGLPPEAIVPRRLLTEKLARRV